MILESLLFEISKSADISKSLVVPISGGSDSAVVFALLNRCFPHKTIGVHCGSIDTLRCSDWFLKTGRVEFVGLPIQEGSPSEKEVFRWAVFLNFALQNKAWLVGCRNRTEQELGTYSLASRVATYLPIVGLYKTQIMSLAETLGVPKEICESSLKADPDCGRPKEMAEIPLETIDHYLFGIRHPLYIDCHQISYLDKIVEGNKFKNNLPILGMT